MSKTITPESIDKIKQEINGRINHPLNKTNFSEQSTQHNFYNQNLRTMLAPRFTEDFIKTQIENIEAKIIKKERLLEMLDDNVKASGLPDVTKTADFKSIGETNKELAILRMTLEKLKNNDSSYGTCECGKLIPKERLEALPTAGLCIDCAEAKTRKKRVR